MSGRHHNFPDYENPPVVEVVCGVQFNPIDKFYAPYLGLLWEKFKPEYPRCNEVPPLAPLIERFDEEKHGGMELSNLPPLPRIWFIHKNENGIIQVQRDRFLLNWRKIKATDEYPRYPFVIENYFSSLNQFTLFLEENGFGKIYPVQYEMTYINHIFHESGWTSLQNVGDLFPDFSFRNNKERFLQEPENIHFRTSFNLPENIGRMHVSIRNAKNIETDSPLIILNLTVRGIGKDKSQENMKEWFDLAREWIVKGFDDLTGEEVKKKVWRKMA